MNLRALVSTSLLSSALLLACTVPDVELAGKACDDSHPCTEGFSCAKGVCVQTVPGACKPGDSRPCGADRGECKPGKQVCQDDGTFSTDCVDAVVATAETCDGKDNDCDGDVDEQVPPTGACELAKGVCAGKLRLCTAGAFETPCTATSYGADFEPTETRCDGKDNDCDGQTDDVPAQGACEKTKGVCAGKQRACTGGAFETPCAAASYGADYEAAAETKCDGKDNDCNGKTDEGLDDDADQYGKSGVSCPKGTDDCDDADPAIHPGAGEVCDGKDNDCDGMRDDGYVCEKGSTGGSCNPPGCGASGTLTCKSDCSGFVCLPPPEVCNGLDDDCSGTPDDNLTSAMMRMGTPAAQFVDIVGQPSGTGGFRVAYAEEDKSTRPNSTWSLVLRTIGTDWALSSAVQKVPATTSTSGSGTNEVRSVALADASVAWIEKAATNNFQVLFKESATATTATVSSTTTSSFSNLVAWAGVDATNTPVKLFAWEESLGTGLQLRLALVRNGAAPIVSRVAPTAGSFSKPTFASINGKPILVWASTENSGNLSAARVDTSSGAVSGTPSLLFPNPGHSWLQPEGAEEALAFSDTTQADQTTRIAVAKLSECGASLCMSAPTMLGTASTTVYNDYPALARVVPDRYVVAWLKTDSSTSTPVYSVEVQPLMASGTVWSLGNGQAMGSPPLPDTVLRAVVASDGRTFGIAVDALATASSTFETWYRTVCP